MDHLLGYYYVQLDLGSQAKKNQIKQDAKAEKKAQKLLMAEQKTLIKKNADGTAAIPTTTGSDSTTTISSRPTPSPIDSHPPSVSSFPLQADSLLSNKITPSTTQPVTIITPQTTGDKHTPLSIHMPPSPPAVLHVNSTSPSGAPPALVEMTSHSGVGVPQASISFAHGAGDLDQVEGYGSAYDMNDENNPLMDPRASVSVERPLSVLGIDLGEKPLTRRHSRHDSARLSV